MLMNLGLLSHGICQESRDRISTGDNLSPVEIRSHEDIFTYVLIPISVFRIPSSL